MKKFDTIMVYPYDFILKYREEEKPVYFDDKKGMNYVLHKGKRLCFPYDNQDDVRYNYNQLRMEQDKDSPHAYFSDGFGLKEDSVFLDVGGAEGMLSLEAIDLASEIYIFECDDAWKQALNNTIDVYLLEADLIEESKRGFKELADEYGNTVHFVKIWWDYALDTVYSKQLVRDFVETHFGKSDFYDSIKKQQSLMKT